MNWFRYITISVLLAAGACAAAPLRVVTSFYPIYISTINVTRDVPEVEVINLTRAVTGCLHDYQLTPQEMKTLTRADVFIINGAGMESFLDEAVRQLPKMKIIRASEGIELTEDNPHVWVSVSLAMKQVENIVRHLEECDPEHAKVYRKNADAYLARLDVLRTRMRETLKNVKSRNIVTFHEAFPYFAKEFGLNIVTVIERDPGSEPSARELAETIHVIRKSGVTALFAEPQYPAKAAEAIARESDAKVYTLDPGVTGPLEPDAYLRIMEKNLVELRNALSK